MMRFKPDISILPGFLFLFDIDCPHAGLVEELIYLAEVNDYSDLCGFDVVVKPKFLNHSEDNKCWLIETIEFYMDEGNFFESVFAKRSLLFSGEIEDERMFMHKLLERLQTYRQEMIKG